jgi:prepilin-type N-terminal cleavage/methylation domain-containing protein
MKDISFNAGFTLLEIMIALALIGSVLVTILYTVNYHADLSYENALMTEMYLLAKEKIIEMELNPEDSKGKIPDTDFRFTNTVTTIPDTRIIELKTTISGKGKTISLREFIVR